MRVATIGTVVLCRLTVLSARAAVPVIAPSQVTPPTAQPPAAGIPSDVNLPRATSPAAPPGVADLEVPIGTVEVVGGGPKLAAPTDAIKARLSGRVIHVVELYQAASDLEQAYAIAGFPLTRVTVPPQRLAPGGAARLLVTEGYIERVELAGVPGRYRGFLWSRLAPLVGKRGIAQAEIERAILLAGDAKGLTLRSAVAAGTQPGGSKLILEGQAALVTGVLSIDNRLPPSLGTWQSSLSLSLNNPLGRGEEVYVLLGTALTGQPAAGLHTPLGILGVGARVPVGDDGVVLGAEYTRSNTRSPETPGVPGTVGSFDRAALKLDYPLIRERQQTLSLTASLESILQVTRAPDFAVELARDQYEALRLVAAWERTVTDSWAWQSTLTVSQGLGGRDEAQAVQTPLSRLGATPDFTTINVEGQLSRGLGLGLTMQVQARGQYSFKQPVFVSEQFALDSPSGVSGVYSGAFSVDSGLTLRAEIRRPFVAELSSVALAYAPYVFAAVGKGWRHRATDLETASPVAGSFGFGLRVDVQGSTWPGLSAQAELARRYSNEDGLRAGNRVTVALVQRF